MKKILVFLTFISSIQLFAQNTIEQGLKYIELEQFGNARRVFSSLVAGAPTAENLYYLGEFYLTIGELDSAKTVFDKGILADAKNGLNYAGLGAIQWIKKDTVEANKNFDQAMTIRKRDAKVYYKIADIILGSEIKNPTKVIALIDKALIYKRDNADYYLVKGDAYLAKNDGNNAVLNYNEALKVNSKSVKAYICKGNLYIRTKSYNEALKLYSDGIALDPSYSPAYRQRAELYFMAKQLSKGLEDYKKYIDMSDDNFDTKFRYAKFIFKSEDYTTAIKYLEELQAKNPNNALIYRLLGYSYYKKNDFNKGLDAIQTYFNKASSDKIIASDYEYLGKAQIATGKDTTVAVENISKAFALDTANAELYSYVATMYFTAKKYKKSAEWFEKIIAANKGTIQEYLNLGKSYYFDKDYLKADNAFERTIAYKPTITNGYFWKARTTVQLDPDYKKGSIKPYCDKYLEIAGQLAEDKRNKKEMKEIYMYAGSYYCNFVKDKVQAEANWRKVLEIDPADKNADAVLKQVADCK